MHDVTFDRQRPLAETPDLGHNRWHPDIAPLITVRSGDTVVLDVRDGIDGQITRDSPAETLVTLDPRRNLPMTGPIAVEGAEPGDLLAIELLEFDPDRFAWSGIFPEYAALKDRFRPHLIFWEVEDGVARSEGLPGVAVRGRPYLGLMGVAPSRESMRVYTERERALGERCGRRMKLPDPNGAIPSDPAIAAEALMPGPPRENGGNMDHRHTTIGSRLLLRVEVPGGLFSVGDPHFNQGDGESLSSAIEMSCRVRLRLSVVKADAAEWQPIFPALTFDAGRLEETGQYYVTTGIPVDFQGNNHLLDVNIAIERALDEMVRYLTDARGYSPEQAGIIIGIAGDIRASQIVNYPNAVISVALPLEIFDGSFA